MISCTKFLRPVLGTGICLRKFARCQKMPASGYCANGKVDSAWRPTRSHFFQGQLLYRVVKNGEQECYFSTAADLPNNSSSIIFTTACCERIKFLKQEKQNCHLHLRISVESGGCSGFQYNLFLGPRCL